MEKVFPQNYKIYNSGTKFRSAINIAGTSAKDLLEGGGREKFNADTDPRRMR
jgi:hypothetical protein